MTPDLAILIATLHEREDKLRRLLRTLYMQIEDNNLTHKVVIYINRDNRQKSTGVKRNELMNAALAVNAKGIAFFDDDDLPGPNYVKLQHQAMAEGYDCASLWGQIYWKGVPGKPFHHSIQYKEWYEDNKFYYRCPNHLNAIKLELVKDIRFQDKVFGEDGNWSMDIQKAGVLKNEFKVEEVIYHYYA